MFTHDVSTLQSERRISLSLRISGEGEARGELEGEMEGEVEGRVEPEGDVGDGMEMLMGRQVACIIIGSTIIQG